MTREEENKRVREETVIAVMHLLRCGRINGATTNAEVISMLEPDQQEQPRISIKVEGKNVADIWSLKCVTEIRRFVTGSIRIQVRTRGLAAQTFYDYAQIGDTIEVDSEESESAK